MPSQEDAFLAIAGGLLVLNALFRCRSAWQQRSQLRDKLQFWCHGCRTWWRRLSLRREPAEAEDQVAAYVEKYVRDKAEKGMRTIWVYTSYIYLISVFTIAWRIVRGESTWMTAGQTIVNLAFCACTSISCLSGIHPGAHLIYAITLAAMCSLVALSYPTTVTIWYLDGCLVVFRLVVTWQYQGWLTVTLFNVVYMCTALYAFGRCAASDQERGWFLLGQVWYALAVFAVAAHSSRTAKAEARGVAERASLREESSAFRDMLELVCDVVAPLDQNLRLVVTFRQTASVKGMRIQDFMPDENDKVAFDNCMSSLSEESSNATTSRVLHSKLRDGLGNILSVELFCVLTRSLFSKECLVGIREFSDYAPAPMASSPTGPKRRARSQPASGDEHTSPGGSQLQGADPGSDAESVHSDPGAQQDVALKRPTTDTGLQLALVRVMSRCVVRCRASCCPYHERLRRISKAVHSLKGVDCLPTFQTSETLQCSACGFLNRDNLRSAVGASDASAGAICFACEAAIERPAPIAL